MDGVVVFAQL